jgi:hypothetical protein
MKKEVRSNASTKVYPRIKYNCKLTSYLVPNPLKPDSEGRQGERSEEQCYNYSLSQDKV